MRTRGSRTGVVYLAVATVAAVSSLVATGCSAPAESELSFAQLSGEVHAADAVETVVHLALVAPSSDPVWSGIRELVVVNDAPEGGDLVFGGGAAELMPGAEEDGLRVGTIAVSVAEDVSDFQLSTVKIAVQQDDELRSYNVGNWAFSRSDGENSVTMADDYSSDLPGCGLAEFRLGVDQAATEQLSVVDVDAPGDGLSVEHVESVPRADGGTSVSFELNCTDDYDMYLFTPKMSLETESGTSEQYLDSIRVGYTDLTGEDLQRIAGR